MRGYLCHELAREIIGCLEGVRPTVPAMQFHDWLEMDGFDIRSQQDLTAWHVTHQARVARLEIAVRSDLVRMGVTMANIDLKGLIQIHESREALEQAAERTLTSR